MFPAQCIAERKPIITEESWGPSLTCQPAAGGVPAWDRGREYIATFYVSPGTHTRTLTLSHWHDRSGMMMKPGDLRFKAHENTSMVVSQLFFQAVTILCLIRNSIGFGHPSPSFPPPDCIFQRFCCHEGWSKAWASIAPTNPSFLSLSFLSILLVWTQKDSRVSNAIVWESYVRVIKAYTVCVLYNPTGFLVITSFYCGAQHK